MTIVGLLTEERFPDLEADDRLLLEPMRRAGLTPRAVRWDGDVAWDELDAIVIRSPWDYYRRPEAFLAWLDAREARGTPIWNPARVIRWNIDKRYLRELAAAGVPVVETAWVERGSTTTIASVLESRGWDRAVFKPSVSAGAWRTYTVDRESAARSEAEFGSLVSERTVMVQPFLDAIVRDGEWSFAFFGDEFQYALIKTPAPDDFRVQLIHGGESRLVARPPRELVAQAHSVLSHVTDEVLYARVDGILDSDGRFLLLELELFEPYLSFGLLDGAAERFVEAMVAKLSRA